jgi:hypothetical protein
MTQVTLRRSISHIGVLQIAIIVLTVITALVHFQKGISMLGMIGGGHPGGAGGGPRSGGPRPGGPPGGGPSIMSMLPLPLPVLFLLDAVAYLVLIVCLYLPALRNFQYIIRWALIVLAALTIIGYFLIAGFRFNLLGYIDKPIEIALIVLLIIEARQATRAKTLG